MHATAQIFLGNARHQQTELPIPELRDGELLAAIDLATICGSDVHTWKGRRTQETPCILGHEAVGTVLQSRRTGVPAGLRISWSLADSCNRCAPCTRYNLPQKCTRLFKYGHAGMQDGSGLNGTFATHILIRPGTAVFRIPDELSDELAAPLNCALATAVHAVEAAGPGETAWIQGAGMLGIYAAALLKSAGYRSVCVTDPSPERLQLAKEFGADQTFQTAPPDGARFDKIFEVCGIPQVLTAGLDRLRPGGQYLLVGLVHPDSAIPFTAEALIRKNAQLNGLHNYHPDHLRAAIEFVAAHRTRFPFEKLVSPPFPLAKLDEALHAAERGAFLRIAIRPS